MSLVLGVFVILGAAHWGQKIIPFLKLKLDSCESWFLGAGLGLGFLALTLFFAGISHQLNPPVLWSLLAVFIVSGFLSQPIRCLNLLRVKTVVTKTGKFDRILVVMAGAVLCFALCGVLTPETANDSLCYHLNLPKRFLQKSSITAIPYDINSGFPLLMEMLYTLGLGTSGVALAKFFHFSTGFIAAGAIFSFARKWTSFSPALWASALFITTPGIINQMGTTYVDVGLACYSVLSLTCLLNGFACESERRRWTILAGLFMGIAMGIKFLALVSLLASAAIILLHAYRQGKLKGISASGLLSFLIVTALVSVLWYFRSYLIWGNPVYPYFYKIFGTGDPHMNYDDIGVPKSLVSFFLSPWIMTMKPDIFEGFGDQIGPAYLLFSPLVLFPGKMKDIRPLVVWILVSFVLWFFLGQSMRFFFPVLTALALLMACAFARVPDSVLPRPVLAFCVLFVLCLHTGFAGFHYRNEIRYVLSRKSSAQYLHEVERTYPVAKWSNQNLLKNSRILAADETHLYYFDSPVIREELLNRLSGYSSKFKTVPEIIRFLKEEGVTHILIVTPVEAPPLEQVMGPMRIPRLIRERENEFAPYLKSLYTYAHANPENKLTYTLYELAQ